MFSLTIPLRTKMHDKIKIMKTWAFEVFCQPIPASMQQQAAKQLEAVIKPLFPDVQVVCTSRRLACFSTTPENIEITHEEIKGPKCTAGENIATKFAQKHNLTLSELVIHDNTYFIPQKQEQIPIVNYLATFTKQIMENFKWPKSMHWLPNSQFRWIRPIISIFNMLDDTIIPLEIAGIQSANCTIINDQPTIFSHAQEYAKHLPTHAFAKRLSTIQQALAGTQHTTELLEEIASSGETIHPFILDVSSLSSHLPALYFQTCVEEHQQAICITENNQITKLLLASHKPTTDLMKTQCFNVIKARIEDMLYLFQQDKAAKLQDWQKQLAHIHLHPKLGTLADKVQRIHRLYPKPEALIFKADLASQIVKEFPKLALHHIQTLHPKLNLLNDPMLTLLDSLDSLVQFFSINVPVSSSEDPLGLKKLAQTAILSGLQIPNLANITTLLHMLGCTNPAPLLEFLNERMLAHTQMLFAQQKTLDNTLICKQKENNFWQTPQKAQNWQNHNTDLISSVFKRLCNFTKKQTAETNATTLPQDPAYQLLPLLDLPSTLANLDHISEKLNEFFDNNLVLDPLYLQSRLALLQQFKKYFAILVPSLNKL